MTDHQPPHSATERDVESIERAVLPVPRSIRELMESEGVWEAWQSRPPYQRREYLEWVTGEEHPSVTAQRMDQMITELRAGNRFMGEHWEE